MQRLQFKVDIKAGSHLVYDVMLGLSKKSTYEEWTSVFNAGSTYEGSWSKGSKIYFVGTSDNGDRGGMISQIVDNLPGQFVSIRHYGILNGNEEILEGDQVEKWAGGIENYTYVENQDLTTVIVDLDAMEEYADYFQTTYPIALEKLKEIVEKSK
ncbi:MAG TPA: hypothetical protein PKC30_09795 [Saprospiraceae bacterium]|nr:hypothetical protein [Saprospiraceae bacterium]